jgi:RHS repeat-associated protein
MAGISDKALKTQYAENKYRYNGGNELQNKEFADGSGLEEYDASARMYDPQIGRFWQQDPLAEMFENWSPYSFANNNPILFNDPLGDSVGLPPITVSNSNINNNSGAKFADPKGGSPNVTAGPAPETAATPVNGRSSSNAAIPIGLTIGTLGAETAGGVSVSAIGAAALPVLVVGVIAYSAYALLTMPQNIPAPLSIPNGDISMGIQKPYIPDDLIKKLAASSALMAASGEKTLEQLVPGSLKRSPSWHEPYAKKTPSEILELAKQGDRYAQKMKKLLDQIDRLLDKKKNK